MTQSLNPTTLPPAFPDHTQLPDSDGTFVHNFLAHPQSILLTDSLETTLQTLNVPIARSKLNGMLFPNFWQWV
jgi:hypothetical protein